jgi:hypothetical protein
VENLSPYQVVGRANTSVLSFCVSSVLEAVDSFQYVGYPIVAESSEWLAATYNLKKARCQWAQVSHALIKQNINPKSSRFLLQSSSASSLTIWFWNLDCLMPITKFLRRYLLSSCLETCSTINSSKPCDWNLDIHASWNSSFRSWQSQWQVITIQTEILEWYWENNNGNLRRNCTLYDMRTNKG